jgi:hypothetical protein
MHRQGLSQACMMVLGILGSGAASSSVRALQPPRPDGEDEFQVLTRGPVHEAFAGTVTFDPEPGIVVTVAPPNPIEEVPPDQRPEGMNVAWIPGYTAWDDERNDYLWVSGVWRAPPPGRQWVPGYWGRSSQGFQWTAGYWGDARGNEVEYLPEPPENAEVGPSVIAPSPDHNWIPGCWIWHHGRYVWRPGYWVSVYSDWDWIPGHYTWSPRGYVFVDGYWDYSIARRGVLFAPVYFNAGVYARRDYYYSPATVISLNVFSDHLFVRQRYHHYYFGDYYDARYSDAGFYSRFAFQSSRSGYDPIYAHQRWKHRQDRDWEVRVNAEFRHRRDHVEARPPRTLSAQVTLNATGRTSTERSLLVAASFDQFAKSKESPIRFQAVDSAEMHDLVQRGKEVRRFRQERQLLETGSESASREKSSARAEPVKLKLPKSAIVARQIDELGKAHAPPKRVEAPDPDPRVEPRPRKAGGRSDASRADDREKPAREAEKGTKGKSKSKPKDD